MAQQITPAHVDSITLLTDNILQIWLKPENYIPYTAGQYLNIIFKDEAYSYSIANAPFGVRKYELHIRCNENNIFHQYLLSQIKSTGAIQIQMPYGNCTVERLKPRQPIIFIAVGTGFAPIKAMLEQLLFDKDIRTLKLFWAARSQSDLYLHDLLHQWQLKATNFHYFPTHAEHKNSLATLIQQHVKDVQSYQFVISGPFDIVFNIAETLVTFGVKQTALFSDAFDLIKDKK